VLGIHAGDEAVGSENVENVQAFYRGIDQSIVAIVLGLMAAGDVRVTALKRDPFAEAKTINVSVAVAADGRQRRGGLRIDQFVKGTSETSAEGMSAGVIVKRSEVFGFILGLRAFGIGSLWGHGRLLF
jgi:putative N-acetylmannosamine-6-phosphate epimerase